MMVFTEVLRHARPYVAGPEGRPDKAASATRRPGTLLAAGLTAALALATAAMPEIAPLSLPVLVLAAVGVLLLRD